MSTTIICMYCGETVTEEDRADARKAYELRTNVHLECAARSVLGSVGHLKGKCSCFGGTEEDPPGLTRREAARAALHYFRNQRELN